MLDRGVVFKVEGWNDEENEVHQKPNALHMLAAVELVVNEKACQVIAAKRDPDVDQIVKPARHDRCALGHDDFDELALEQLVAVEENVIHVPGTGSRKKTATEMSDGNLQGFRVVTCHSGFLLGDSQLLVGSSFDFVCSIVDQPKGAYSRDGE